MMLDYESLAFDDMTPDELREIDEYYADRDAEEEWLERIAHLDGLPCDIG